MGNAPLRKRGRIWHIEATIRGRRIRESCETEDRAHAIALARQRIAELEQTGPVALRAPKLTFEQLAADFIRDYEINGRRSVGKAKKSVEKLAEVFAGWKAINITAADVRGYVPKEELVRLYQQAACLVFPSRYEGFGLPVVEAMACGTPVVAAPEKAMQEVAGDAAIFTDDLAEGITRALLEHDRLAAAGIERAKAFSWEETARLTADVYRSVLAA